MIFRSIRSCALILFAITSLGFAQKPAGNTASNRIVLGRLASGATVSFVNARSGEWGVEISG
ncbi:MAG TPA: hypothetical protein VL498_08750, partial [Terracidiphilus sp.]|nr:hypothetical protein [Terracidiphilus sp.]